MRGRSFPTLILMCDLRRGKVIHHGLFPFHRESCLMRVRLRRDPEPDFTTYAGLAQRRLHLICNEAFTGGSSPSPSSTRTGRVAERPIAPVLKTDERTKTPRGFESHLFRHTHTSTTFPTYIGWRIISNAANGPTRQLSLSPVKALDHTIKH